VILNHELTLAMQHGSNKPETWGFPFDSAWRKVGVAEAPQDLEGSCAP
jgi:hypothetical protein